MPIGSRARAERIDAAVSKAAELIGLLLDLGTVTPAQTKLIVGAAVRAVLPNAEMHEVAASVERIVVELGERNENHYDEM